MMAKQDSNCGEMSEVAAAMHQTRGRNRNHYRRDHYTDLDSCRIG